MKLYYDRVSKMFTLETDDEDEPVVFLGPITNALVMLRKEFGLTDSQAREATLQAIFNLGDVVYIDIIKKIASKESQYFQRA